MREGGKVEGRKERRKDLKKKYSHQTSKCEPFPGKGISIPSPCARHLTYINSISGILPATQQDGYNYSL